MFKEKNIEDRGLKNFQKQNFDIVKIEGLYKNDSSSDESNNFHLEESSFYLHLHFHIHLFFLI